MRGWGIDAEISHNTVANCARNGIEAIDNSLDASGAGRIRVSHNRVRSATVGSPWPVPFRPNGIVVGWFFFPTDAIDPLETRPTRCRRTTSTWPVARWQASSPTPAGW